MNRPAALLLCVVAAQSVLHARAHAMLDFALDIDAPPDANCTQARVLQHTIEERVGSLVFLDEAQPSRRIGVRISADDASSSWSADIVMRDERGKLVGERHVTTKATTCDALDEALVVVISTLIGIADQTTPAQPHVAEPVPRPPAHGAEPTHANTNADATRTAPAKPRFVSDPNGDHDDDSHFELAASVAARGDFGLLPGIAPGVALALDLDFGAWALVLGGALLPYAVDNLGEGAKATFTSALGDARLCLNALRPRAATLAFCAGAEVGMLAVSTSGLAARATRVEPLVRGVIGPRLRLSFERHFGLLAGLAAAVPIYAPRYFVFGADGGRQFYHSVGLGISAQIGVYWLFAS